MIVFLDTGVLYPGQYIVLATTNVKHLQRFIEAQEWEDINF